MCCIDSVECYDTPVCVAGTACGALSHSCLCVVGTVCGVLSYSCLCVAGTVCGVSLPGGRTMGPAALWCTTSGRSRRGCCASSRPPCPSLARRNYTSVVTLVRGLTVRDLCCYCAMLHISGYSCSRSYRYRPLLLLCYVTRYWLLLFLVLPLQASLLSCYCAMLHVSGYSCSWAYRYRSLLSQGEFTCEWLLLYFSLPLHVSVVTVVYIPCICQDGR